MADKIESVISVAPLETASVSIDQGSKTMDVVATEIGTLLGGKLNDVSPKYNNVVGVQGYADGAVGYLEAPNGSDQAITTLGTASFLFIKNTGFEYSSSTVLGDALDESIKVKLGASLLGIIKSGECLVFKDDNEAIDPTAFTVRTVTNAGGVSTNTLAVEFFISGTPPA